MSKHRMSIYLYLCLFTSIYVYLCLFMSIDMSIDMSTDSMYSMVWSVYSLYSFCSVCSISLYCPEVNLVCISCSPCGCYKAFGPLAFPEGTCGCNFCLRLEGFCNRGCCKDCSQNHLRKLISILPSSSFSP